jgi:TRAP transporter 4TM/12TM fusion protein
MSKSASYREWCLGAICLAWLGFQIWILFYPQPPLVQRPVHLISALAVLYLARPLFADGPRLWRNLTDGLALTGIAAFAVYIALSASRLTERMETIDPVFAYDVVCGLVVLLLLFEGVRRTVGWSLLSVLLVFFAYGFLGAVFPGWLYFRGFGIEEATEILTMTTNGVLGITTATSLQFVFYFILFGVVYSAIGGGQLFIDIALKIAGRYPGGAAKAAVISSSLMGSISGSAVANVATTGVFTIPLMRRTGYSKEDAAAIEAIASTGGQLMPPVMGIAAFVMAEMLQVPYLTIVAAGLIPALAFYVAIFLMVDLRARRNDVGRLAREDISVSGAIGPRLYLLLPPIVLIGFLVTGTSATLSALYATASCVVTCYLRRETWLAPRSWLEVVVKSGRQTADVAIPIASIGVIIAVAIQSNLALNFSSGLIGASGGLLYVAMGLIILGCLIMGMGLPTVAAYIIGAVLFVPALIKLGIPELAAHFFVMYYCVLSMVTPPVALASYTAAGLSGAGAMQTSLKAFSLSLVSFLIPFAFAFDQTLLAKGDLLWIAIGFSSLAAATALWAMALAGYFSGVLSWPVRIIAATLSIIMILSPTGSTMWAGALAASFLFGASLVVFNKQRITDLG